jgi:monoamine oxidase
MDTSGRVIVVGAGLAGLSAAGRLADHGVDLTVLEARERVGGRVWSSTLTNGAVVELGGEWIMDDDHEVRAMAVRYDLELVETGADYRRREPWGTGAASLEAQETFLAAAERARGALAPAEIASLSLGAFLARVDGDDDARRLVMTRLQGTCAQDLGTIALDPGGDGGIFAMKPAPYHRVGRGNQALADAMAARLGDVRLGHSVDAIVTGPDDVLVRVGPHEEAGAVVVVAVPAPIAARLSFTPALPDDLGAALTGLSMGVASKFAVATTEMPTARTRQATDVSMWCWAANGDDGQPRRCIAAFAGSTQAQEILGVDRGRVEPWLERLEAMNPDVAFDGEPVLYAWADDPYTLGAYSAWDATSLARAHVLTRPASRVVFAGEHTAGAAHHGTMNGALLSGRRAADQVLAMLGR